MTCRTPLVTLCAVREITVDSEEYVRSLRVSDEPATLCAVLDGALLVRVAEEHFVVLSCTEHQHTGSVLLARVIPPHWERFSEARNSEQGWQAEHYGPTIEAVTP